MPPSVPAYTLTRKRMRNLRLRVDAPSGNLLVSAPPGVPRAEIDAFVVSREQWIARRRAQLVSLPPPLTPGPQTEAYSRQLRAWVEDMLPGWCERMGVPTPCITLKTMKTRWGSCRKDTRRISLNIELARRGRDSAEYVLVHELAHLIESNHGPGFYALMDAHLPDWKQRRRALRSPG